MARTPRAPRLTVPVSREVIEDGIQRDSAHCVVAEAIKAVYPDASRVAVDLQTVRFSDLKKGLRFTYLTPRIAQVALVNYDQGTEPEPFEFSLRSGQVTLAGKRSSGKILTAAQQKQREKAAGKGRARMKKARLVDRKKSEGSVPDVVGGKPPPVVPGGARRAFGLRGLER